MPGQSTSGGPDVGLLFFPLKNARIFKTAHHKQRNQLPAHTSLADNNPVLMSTVHAISTANLAVAVVRSITLPSRSSDKYASHVGRRSPPRRPRRQSPRGTAACAVAIRQQTPSHQPASSGLILSSFTGRRDASGTHHRSVVYCCAVPVRQDAQRLPSLHDLHRC